MATEVLRELFSVWMLKLGVADKMKQIQSFLWEKLGDNAMMFFEMTINYSKDVIANGVKTLHK